MSGLLERLHIRYAALALSNDQVTREMLRDSISVIKNKNELIASLMQNWISADSPPAENNTHCIVVREGMTLGLVSEAYWDDGDWWVATGGVEIHDVQYWMRMPLPPIREVVA